MTLETGMNIGWPEGIWLGLVALSVLTNLFMDGKEKPPRSQVYSFSDSLAGALSVGILLYWGGFFK